MAKLGERISICLQEALHAWVLVSRKFNDATRFAEVNSSKTFFNFQANTILERHLVVSDRIFTMSDLRNMSAGSDLILNTARDQLKIRIMEHDKRKFAHLSVTVFQIFWHKPGSEFPFWFAIQIDDFLLHSSTPNIDNLNSEWFPFRTFIYKEHEPAPRPTSFTFVRFPHFSVWTGFYVNNFMNFSFLCFVDWHAKETHSISGVNWLGGRILAVTELWPVRTVTHFHK